MAADNWLANEVEDAFSFDGTVVKQKGVILELLNKIENLENELRRLRNQKGEVDESDW